MHLEKKYALLMSALLIVGSGCGSDGEKVSQESGEVVVEDNNDTPNTNNEGNNTNPIIAGYERKTGYLIETKSDGSKLAWVNSASDALCKISRPDSRSGSVYEDAIAHCNKLASENYVGINGWRVPTVEESKYIMDRSNNALLIFPTSNPNCAIMTTSVENTFVYTTSSWNSEDNVGKEFIDSQRNGKTAGIRCVATQ